MKFTGQQVCFERDDLIVSKTDLQGRLTYVNHTFIEVSGFTETDCIGKQHNLIRDQNMPRCVFDLLWKTIAAGREIFAYVVNATKTGGHYWVIAHITPSIQDGRAIGYHSTRRTCNPNTVREIIIPLYDSLKRVEESNTSKKAGLEAAGAALRDMLAAKGASYDAFMSDLMRND
jgi:PAS domain S-box-containing protein